jgi:NAD(P)-dependent dehydrogenase (short-subunit alcohol dehydrogenase family)
LQLLEEKVVVVVGGTSGIGAHIVEVMANEDAIVVAAGRRAEVGESLASRLGDRVFFVQADATIEDSVADLVGGTVERYGRIDCIVNNAGEGGAVGNIASADVERFMRTFRIHVAAPLIAMKHAGAAMAKAGRGSIINVASIGGQLAGWTSPDYSAAKAAVIHLTRCAAVELAVSGVRVNSISPGPTLTGIFAKAAGIDPSDADATAYALEPVFASRLTEWQPLQRVARPLDIAPAALWLASDGSAFVTGQNITVDGGITAGRPTAAAQADRAAMAEVLFPRRDEEAR